MIHTDFNLLRFWWFIEKWSNVDIFTSKLKKTINLLNWELNVSLYFNHSYYMFSFHCKKCKRSLIGPNSWLFCNFLYLSTIVLKCWKENSFGKMSKLGKKENYLNIYFKFCLSRRYEISFWIKINTQTLTDEHQMVLTTDKMAKNYNEWGISIKQVKTTAS